MQPTSTKSKKPVIWNTISGEKGVGSVLGNLGQSCRSAEEVALFFPKCNEVTGEF